jgi:hypothetical protein
MLRFISGVINYSPQTGVSHVLPLCRFSRRTLHAQNGLNNLTMGANPAPSTLDTRLPGNVIATG